VSRTTLKTTLRSLAFALALGALPAFAFAGPATDVVKEKQTALFELIKAPKPDQTKIGALFDEMLDYDTLAKASLADAWGSLTEPQRKEFTGLLKQLVQKSYERNLKKTLNFNIEYLSEDKASDGQFLVKTKATHKTDKREAPIAIHFKLQDKGNKKFKVIDIVTEDVSLVDSYKGQFTKVIKKDGFDALVKKMKDKIAKGE
jgi:phospholipid transport system substrate-binding protein